MAKKKKIKKPVYVTREERRKKNPMPKKTKIIIASVCGALALALILFVLLYDDGSLPVRNGIVQVEGDNWLVTNLNTQNRQSYFKQAEVNAPEGFVLEPGNSLKSDSNETAFWFVPEDENNPIRNFYVSGNAQNVPDLVESVHPQFLAFYGPEDVGDPQIGPVGRNIGQFFTAYYEEEMWDEDAWAIDEVDEAEETASITDPEEDLAEADPLADEPPADEAPAEEESPAEGEPLAEEAPEAEEQAPPAEPEPRVERISQFVAYFPAYRNSSIVFVMSVRIEEGAERPTLEELLELAAPLADSIEVYVPER